MSSVASTSEREECHNNPLHGVLLLYGFDLPYHDQQSPAQNSRHLEWNVRSVFFAVVRAIYCVTMVSVSVAILSTLSFRQSLEAGGGTLALSHGANGTDEGGDDDDDDEWTATPEAEAVVAVVSSMRQMYRSAALTYLQATVTLLVTNWHYCRIRRLSADVHGVLRQVTRLDPTITPRIKRFGWMFCLFPLLAFVAMIAPLMVWFASIRIDDIFRRQANMKLLYGLSPTDADFGSGVPVLGVALDAIRANLRTFTMVMASTGFFAITCHVHMEGFSNMTSVLTCVMFETIGRVYSKVADGGGEEEDEEEEIRRRGANENRIAEFIHWHRILCRLVTLADDTFGLSSFLAIACEVANMIFLLRVMNLGNSAEMRGPLLALWIPLLLCVIFLVVKAILSTGVNEKVLSSLKTILDVDPDGNNDNGNIPSIEVADKILQYVKHVQMSPPALTAWNFFVIDNGCLLSAGGYILTYTLMLYGIQ